MAPFVNLFNNQLQATHVFSANFTSADIATLLRGIGNNPATYGLDAAAATVARAFVNNQGLIDIIPQPITVDNMDIRDLGAALGYLLSRQAVTQQNLETGYRPILHAYGRFLQVIGFQFRTDIGMSTIVFDAATPRWLYGSTIAVHGPNRGRKAQVQADRLGQLKAALLFRGVPLPPFTLWTLRELARQLANVKIPEQAHANLRYAPPNILRLYERLITALVTDSNGTYPMRLTFATDLTQYNIAQQNVVNAEVPALRNFVVAATTPNLAFKTYLESFLSNSCGPEFGHCAESFPFILILRNVQNRAQTQGLAMEPIAMDYLTPQQITTGTTSYNRRRTFRYPCENCTEVLQLAGMTPNVFNTYILTAIIPHFDPYVR